MAKRRKRRLNIKFLISFFIVFVLLTGLIGYNYYKGSLKAISKQSEEVLFTVESGASTKSIVEKLAKEKIIKNSNTTLIYIKSNKLTTIKAGDYVLNKNWDVKTIFEYITTATNAITNDVKVTIIEGDWAKDEKDG